MSSSSGENIVDLDKEDNLIDWFDIEINQNVNLNDNLNNKDEEHDFHIVDDIVDDYDLLNKLNDNPSDESNKSKNIIYNTINNTINTTFMIENIEQNNQENNQIKKEEHIIIEIPESECFVEPVQEIVQEPVQEIINNQEDVKEYQNDLYNYLNLKYVNLLNRLNTINNFIFARPYMHRFGNTINNLYNRVYYFFENNMTMIYNIGIYFGIYGFVRIGYNLIIRNQYRYIRNCIRNVRYYLYNFFS